MSKILLVLPRFHTNAAPWVRILQEAGHEVTVHVQRIGPIEDHRRATPQLIPPARWARRLARLLPPRADPDFRHAPPLRAYWRRMKADAPDLVIVRGVSRWLCLTAAITALLQGRRLAVYDQDDPQPRAWSGTWGRRRLCALLGAEKITARACQTSAAGPLTTPGAARTLPFAAARCSETLAREARHRIAQDAGIARILMVGKYRERKGHAQLLEVLASLAARRHFSLTICAEESSRADRIRRDALEARAKALGIADRVRFLANVERSDMMRQYSEHAIFILPSRDEPAAVSPIEAVWHGALALVDHRSGTRHYLPAGDSFVFDARHPRDIARALDPVLASPDALRDARMACLAHLHELGSDAAVRQVWQALLPRVNTDAAPVDLHPQSSDCRAT